MRLCNPNTMGVLVLFWATFSPLIAKCDIRLDYRYIKIETPDIEVGVMGYSELLTKTFKGFDHRKFPLSYELNREKYSISISLVLDSNHPMLLIVAKDSADRSVTLGGEVEDKCYGYFLSTDFREHPIDEAATTLRFTWMSRISEECLAREKPIGIATDMRLRVYAIDGSVLGEEVLTYTVQENGYYFVKDGP